MSACRRQPAQADYGRSENGRAKIYVCTKSAEKKRKSNIWSCANQDMDPYRVSDDSQQLLILQAGEVRLIFPWHVTVIKPPLFDCESPSRGIKRRSHLEHNLHFPLNYN